MNRTQVSLLIGAYYVICVGMSIGLMIASDFSEKFTNYILVLNLMAITPIFIDMILDIKSLFISTNILNGKKTRRYD